MKARLLTAMAALMACMLQGLALPQPCAMAAQQRARVQDLAAQGLVLPPFEWGTLEPRRYDVALGAELQYFTLEVAAAYGVGGHYELVLALMFRESSFRPWLVSRTDDWGLMQINAVNHERYRRDLGITDFLCPYQSILAGIHHFAPLLLSTQCVHHALMCYNLGAGRANRMWREGTRSTAGSRRVVETWELLLETGGI